MSSSPDRADISRSRTIEGVPGPTGPFSWAVRAGDLVYVAGVRGIDPDTGNPAATDEERLVLIFRHLGRILSAYGCAARNVVATRVYVTDMKRLRPLVNDAYERYFGDELPTRTIVEVGALNQDDSIEIEAVFLCAAAAGSPRGQSDGMDRPAFL